MAKKPKEEPLWEISHIKGTPARVLGRIRAPDAERAIKTAIETWSINDPVQQERLMARRVRNS